MSTPRILLTGHTGYIGRQLQHHLILQGREVVTLGRRDADFDFDAPDEEFPRFDIVIHAAGAGVSPNCRDARSLVEGNILITKRVSDIARNCADAICYIGSCSEYAPTAEGVRIEESAELSTDNAYGLSKYAGGAIVAESGPPYAHLRLFNLFGPGEASHRLTTSLWSSLDRGQSVALSAGVQKRDFLHITDAIQGIEMALDHLMERGELGVVNICTGQATSVCEFAIEFARQMSASEELLEFGTLDPRPNEGVSCVGDPRRMSDTTRWRARLDVRDGIAQTIDAMQRGGRL